MIVFDLFPFFSLLLPFFFPRLPLFSPPSLPPGVKQYMLETVIPKTPGASVMVVGGKRKGQVRHNHACVTSETQHY